MADEEQDGSEANSPLDQYLDEQRAEGELESSGSFTREQEPQQPGAARRAFDAFSAQARRSTATKAVQGSRAGSAVASGTRAAATRLGEATVGRLAVAGFLPEIIAGLLILLAIGVTVISIGFILCVSNGCQGKQAFDPAIDPARNKQDALSVQTIACLNKAAQIGDKGDGPLPGECEKPIKAWADQVVTEATALKGKVDSKETAAIKILDDLLTAANKAKGVTTAMKVKEARVIADELSRQYQLAVNNAVIAKARGFSAGAQKIVTYLAAHPDRQTGSKDCLDTDKRVMANAFGVGSAPPGATLGGTHDGAPSAADLDGSRKVLADGGIPVWLIRGEASGEHWIIVLNIDTANNITYYDPNGGGIHTHESTWGGPAGKWQYFFGNPTTTLLAEKNYFVNSPQERGYSYFPPK